MKIALLRGHYFVRKVRFSIVVSRTHGVDTTVVVRILQPAGVIVKLMLALILVKGPV